MNDETPKASAFAPAEIGDGTRVVNGVVEMQDARGAWLPVTLIKPQHVLQDQLVRKIMGYGIALSGQVERFKAHNLLQLSGLYMGLYMGGHTVKDIAVRWITGGGR